MIIKIQEQDWVENGHLEIFHCLESFVDMELVEVTKGKSQRKDQRLILWAPEFQEIGET